MKFKNILTLLALGSILTYYNPELENKKEKLNKISNAISSHSTAKQLKYIDSLVTTNKDFFRANTYTLDYIGLTYSDLLTNNYNDAQTYNLRIGIENTKTHEAYILNFNHLVNNINVQEIRNNYWTKSEKVKKQKLNKLLGTLKKEVNGYIINSSMENDAFTIIAKPLTEKEYESSYAYNYYFKELNPEFFCNGKFKQSLQHNHYRLNQKTIIDIIKNLQSHFDEMHIEVRYKNISLENFIHSELPIQNLSRILLPLKFENNYELNLGSVDLQKKSIEYFKDSHLKTNPSYFYTTKDFNSLIIPFGLGEEYSFAYYIDKNNDGFVDEGGISDFSFFGLSNMHKKFFIEEKTSMKLLKYYADQGFLKPHRLKETYLK